jgi:ATP-dependent DNA helicase RecQ
LLRGEVSLSLRLPAVARERRHSADGERERPATLELAEDGQRRFEVLRTWRLEQAREQGVPPYVVFHDRTLIEIASRRPTSLEELGGVSGVGQTKLDRYGEALLAAFRNLGGLS